MTDTTILKTVSDVVAALGGTSAVVELTQSQFSQVVSNWISRNRFASRTYLILTAALEDRGLTADPNLWGITPADGPLAAEAAE